MLLILWHNRLPWQQYDQLETPLILALSAYNSKTSSVFPIFYYRIVISMTTCNFLQSLKKFCEGGSEPPPGSGSLNNVKMTFEEVTRVLKAGSLDTNVPPS